MGLSVLLPPMGHQERDRAEPSKQLTETELGKGVEAGKDGEGRGVIVS